MLVLNRTRRRRYAGLLKATLLVAGAAVLLTPKHDLTLPSFPLVTAAHAAPGDFS
jgi:hypothetical protein